MRRTVVVFLGLVGVAALLGGCVTLNKFDALKERVEALEKEKAEIVERVKTGEGRLENLYGRFKESQDDLRKTGADQGATLDEVRQLIAEVNGKLEEMAWRTENQRQQVQAVIDVLDEKLGTTITVDPGTLPTEPGALFDLGTQRLSQGMAGKARSVFRLYVQRHPQEDKADDAQYGIAETYVLEKKPDLAIREYQALHDQYPKSELVPKALWRIAELLISQKECKKAEAVLKYLRDTQKKTPEAEKVPDQLKEMKKSCS